MNPPPYDADVTVLMRWLSVETKSLTYVCHRAEYRDSRTQQVVGEEFYVMTSGGNVMMVVPQTHAPTALGALWKAIDRWLYRPESTPYTR